MKIVPHLPNGSPVDIKWMNYNRLFNGIEFIVFDDYDEYISYMNENYPSTIEEDTKSQNENAD